MTHNAPLRPTPPILLNAFLLSIFTAFRAVRLSCFVTVILLAGCQSTPSPHAPAASSRSSSDGALTSASANASVSASATSASTAAGAPRSPALTERAIALADESTTIFFPQRVTAVDRIGKEKLRLHAEQLKQDPKRAVFLIGYTNDSGSSSYNLIIAEERIESVKKLLRAYGVPSRQILRKSVRINKSPAACISTDCRRKKPRVELLYRP